MPGCADGADGNPRPPAYGRARAARQSRRRAHGVADGPRARRRPRRNAGRAGRRQDRHPRRHARAVLRRRRLPRSRTRRRRRAASLRRASAHAAAGQGQQARRCAGDDGDTHPAHARTHRLWRHGRLAPDGPPAGAQAGANARALRRAARRSGRASAPRDRQRRARLLGMPAGRGVREDRPRRRRGARRPRCAKRWGRWWGWCMAA